MARLLKQSCSEEFSAARKGHFGPTKGIPAPNAGKGRWPAEPLSPGEVEALIGQCSRRAPTGIRNRALLTLLYRSGLRVSEILSLRPSDVGFDKHLLRLLDTKSGRAQTPRLPPVRRRRPRALD